MPDWFDADSWAVWLGTAVVLGAVEAATADFVFLMLAGGALAATVAAFLGLGVVGQCLIAAAVSVALLGAVRPVVKRRLSAPQDVEPLGTERYLGRVVQVTETVTETSGFASVDSEIWSARLADDAAPLAVGASARITEVRGATLVLAPTSPVRDLPQRREPA